MQKNSPEGEFFFLFYRLMKYLLCNCNKCLFHIIGAYGIHLPMRRLTFKIEHAVIAYIAKSLIEAFPVDIAEERKLVAVSPVVIVHMKNLQVFTHCSYCIAYGIVIEAGNVACIKTALKMLIIYCLYKFNNSVRS